MSKPAAADFEPVTEDDAFIEAALREAHIPTLMTALVHLTGDTKHLRAGIRPQSSLVFDEQMNIPPDQQKEAKAIALEVLKAYRDRGCTLPPEPSDAIVGEMMDYIMGEEIPRSYMPLLKEELALHGEETRLEQWRNLTPSGIPDGFHVVVIGAGMSGILAAIGLKEAGIPFEIIEKNAAVAGTWFENTYPGCRVDSPNHLYSYSFEPNHDWPQFFSTHDTLFSYFDRCVDKYGIRDAIRFETEVEAARFNDETGRWAVTVKSKDGPTRTIDAAAVITATGQLNRPRYPDIKGVGRFEGPAFHSAIWDHGVDLKGKKVAVIGTGASAFQFVPEITKEVDDLVIFQRTPPWMRPAPHYHAPVPDGTRWLMRHMPYYANWYRFWIFWLSAEGLLPMVKVDPSWNDLSRSVSPANDELRKVLTDYIEEQVDGVADLLEKAVPRYPVGGKRILVDNGSWIRALRRENVHVVTDPIAEITRSGLRTESGKNYDVDVLIYGTGFHADRFLWPMEITGKGGVSLNDQWAGDPRAYMGITIPNFPNLFCLYGPNTNIVVNGSIIFFSECELRYVLGCLKMLIEEGHRAMAPRKDVHDAYNERIDAENEQMAWGVPTVNSWYKNDAGRVTQNWPGTLLEYWAQTRLPDPADYEFT